MSKTHYYKIFEGYIEYLDDLLKKAQEPEPPPDIIVANNELSALPIMSLNDIDVLPASLFELTSAVSKPKKKGSHLKYKTLVPDLINAVNRIKRLMVIYMTDGCRQPWGRTYEICKVGIEYSKTQPNQGTKEWLDSRKNRISASDIGTALEENEHKHPDLVIIEKCGYPDHWWFGADSEIFCHHGHKYEFVASQIHEVNYDVNCHEAGFVPHPAIDFIGASPDKYVLDEKNHRGYLVEIKCPYRRFPKPHSIPRYYWIQMQIQMEVTGLDECYFEDCKILEYFDEDEYLADSFYTCPKKGVVGEVHDLVSKTIHYIYPKIYVKGLIETEEERYYRMKAEIQKTAAEMSARSERYYFKGFSWWKLVGHQSILVFRDREWFASVLPKIKTFWQTVLHHREHGIDELLKKYGKPTIAELGQKKQLVKNSEDETLELLLQMAN